MRSLDRKQAELKKAEKLRAQALMARDVELYNEALKQAYEAYPDYLDKGHLLNEESDTHWPEDLFESLFPIPEVVVTYEDTKGHVQRIEMWSRATVDHIATDPRYQLHVHQLKREREERDAAQKREEEYARLEREEQEHQRQLQEAQVVVTIDELRRRRESR